MDNIKKPKLTLKERYNDEFLEKAEIRRKALQYKRMHVGQINTDRMAHMIKLLYQVHQNYYLGYFEASCTLAGSMFEQSLMILLEEKINEDGFISIKKLKNGKPYYEKITNVEDLAQCNIGILISIVGYYKMLPNNEYNLAKTLQNIRNCIVHDMLPKFSLIDGYYQAEIKINLSSNITKVVKISEAEIKNRTTGQSSIELWSYFLLTRTRSLIEFLFINRVKKFPPEF
ncbi:hypothetical protein [Brachyspira aalborgi]|uniref:Uncharacterized protein n=1 Tax=Brachyspira aalborgi TaxID=29522 RepID=A0A5C8FCG1_9SPIR|nr:hypothetical protein [Brachyspira aalborgi]TXJ47453.1 hypothetical protein EPJ84_11550 [Brachyspira aalborgi]